MKRVVAWPDARDVRDARVLRVDLALSEMNSTAAGMCSSGGMNCLRRGLRRVGRAATSPQMTVEQLETVESMFWYVD